MRSRTVANSRADISPDKDIFQGFPYPVYFRAYGKLLFQLSIEASNRASPSARIFVPYRVQCVCAIFIICHYPQKLVFQPWISSVSSLVSALSSITSGDGISGCSTSAVSVVSGALFALLHPSLFQHYCFLFLLSFYAHFQVDLE